MFYCKTKKIYTKWQYNGETRTKKLTHSRDIIKYFIHSLKEDIED